MNIQADLLVCQCAKQVKADVSKTKEQPWASVAEGNRPWVAAGTPDHVPELIKGVTEAYDGIGTHAFEEHVPALFATAEHADITLVAVRRPLSSTT